MSTARTQEYVDARASGLQVIETDADTSTVQAAAVALGVEPAATAPSAARPRSSRGLVDAAWVDVTDRPASPPEGAD